LLVSGYLEIGRKGGKGELQKRCEGDGENGYDISVFIRGRDRCNDNPVYMRDSQAVASLSCK
jgi:hypothetical protein